MKTLKESILSSTNTGKASFIPKTKEELQLMIKKEIKKKGNNCNLNHIKTHKITDMSSLFDDRELYYFNGDISKWDVSNVTNMELMFFDCDFNGDISNWDVSNVEKMSGMFSNSKFNNNSICNWDVSNVKYMSVMFASNKIFNQDITKWKIKPDCRTAEMFGGECPIEEKYKPFKNGKRIK